jgi:hypothetical protein
MGFPAFKPVCIYYFRRSDLEMLARLVHGDVEKHVRQKEIERNVRRIKARRTRVRDFRIKHHQEKIEVSTGAVANRHARGNMDEHSPGEKNTELTVNRAEATAGCRPRG